MINGESGLIAPRLDEDVNAVHAWEAHGVPTWNYVNIYQLAKEVLKFSYLYLFTNVSL